MFRFEFEIGNKECPRMPFKSPRLRQKRSGNTKVAGRHKKRSYAKLEASSEISERTVRVVLPIRTVSEANSFEPWRLKHARHKEQQRLVALALNPLRPNMRLPCRLMLTRFAPDELDAFDNLPMSFKYIVDAVCAIITGDYRAGHADSDKRISIACDQKKSDAYGIRIEITW
jgi:HrpA-like RNA helicase